MMEPTISATSATSRPKLKEPGLRFSGVESAGVGCVPVL